MKERFQMEDGSKQIGGKNGWIEANRKKRKLMADFEPFVSSKSWIISVKEKRKGHTGTGWGRGTMEGRERGELVTEEGRSKQVQVAGGKRVVVRGALASCFLSLSQKILLLLFFILILLSIVFINRARGLWGSTCQKWMQAEVHDGVAKIAVMGEIVELPRQWIREGIGTVEKAFKEVLTQMPLRFVMRKCNQDFLALILHPCFNMLLPVYIILLIY